MPSVIDLESLKARITALKYRGAGLPWGTRYNEAIEDVLALLADSPTGPACVCGHLENDHETVEYRGDKSRACMHGRPETKCRCKRFEAKGPAEGAGLVQHKADCLGRVMSVRRQQMEHCTCADTPTREDSCVNAPTDGLTRNATRPQSAATSNASNSGNVDRADTPTRQEKE